MYFKAMCLENTMPSVQSIYVRCIKSKKINVRWNGLPLRNIEIEINFCSLLMRIDSIEHILISLLLR